MTWKKTWFSYFLWGLSSILICLVFVLVGTSCMEQYSLSIYWLAALVAVVLLCYLISVLCKEKMKTVELSKSFVITFESLVFVGLLAGGLLVRLYSLTDVSGQELFQVASISESSESFSTSHGAFGVYIILLRSLFYFIGNSWVGAVILQITLQLLSFVLLYFVVRKTTGVVAALTSYAFFMFSPESIKIGVGLYPATFYLLLCVLALYFLTESNQKILENQKIMKYQFLAALFIGLLGGVILYLDVVGIFLLLLGLSFFGLQSKETQEGKIKYRPFYFILYVVGVLLGLVILLAFDAKFTGQGIMECFLDWEGVYSPALGQKLYSILTLQMDITGWIYIGILFFVLLLGVLGFWESRQSHPQFGWSLMVLLLLVMQYNCPGAANMSRMYFLYIAVAILAGSGMQALFTKDKEVAEFEMEFEDTIDVENVNEEIKYIPNPLPLPKKHVKKTMSYGIEVEKEQMCFDIETTDEDDFDI